MWSIRGDNNVVRSINRHSNKSRSVGNRPLFDLYTVRFGLSVVVLFFLVIALLSYQSYIVVEPMSASSLSRFSSITGSAVVETSDPSAHATVMGMATNYNKEEHQRFIGSLRHSGFTGHIILGIEPTPLPGVIPYLISQNVTIHQLTYTPCTYRMKVVEEGKNQDNAHVQELATCVHPYADIKIRWSRFPLLRDWLQECETCTGPVLVTDVRDVLFQRNPFGSSTVVNSIRGLQVFEEHELVTAQNWLTEWPIRECKNVTYFAPMLCSGTTVGTRTAMLYYFNTMYDEMKVWINDPKCRFEINGDDQSIHNYIYYSGKLKNATSIPFRQPGSIVNTIGAYADMLFTKYGRPKKQGETQTPYPGSTYHLPNAEVSESTATLTWIGVELNISNADGYLVDADGITISPVVHQYDRFGPYYSEWLKLQPWTTYS